MIENKFYEKKKVDKNKKNLRESENEFKSSNICSLSALSRAAE